MRANVERIRSTRSRLCKELAALGYETLPSEANFVLARRPGKSLSGVAATLREQGVLVRYFTEVPDGLRITVGTDEQIDVLLDRLRAI